MARIVTRTVRSSLDSLRRSTLAADPLAALTPSARLAALRYVLMIFRPALRLATAPFPPFRLAARFLAAAILPPLVFFILKSSPSFDFWEA
jgi:hypothetical protein